MILQLGPLLSIFAAPLRSVTYLSVRLPFDTASKRKSARGTEVKAPAPPADKKQEAWDLVLQTYEALLEERGAGEKIWGSMIKQTLKRRKPGFSESYYGFKSFGQLLEEAEAQGILQLERDEKSGGFILRGGRSAE